MWGFRVVTEKEYVIRFLDEEEDLVVIFLRLERGFYVFKSIIGEEIIVARPTSITVREK